MIPGNRYLLPTGSFLHIIPFTSRGSTWHPQMKSYGFLVLSCFCLYFYYELMSLYRVVYVLGVVAPVFFNGKICRRRRLESLGNFIYPGGYCSSSYPKSLIIVNNRLTWGDTSPENSWWRCNHCPTCRSFLVPRVSWPCIFPAQILRWMTQNFGSRIQWIHLTLVLGIKCP